MLYYCSKDVDRTQPLIYVRRTAG